MRACYCWAVFRNKRKLKSLAVRRHPELRGGGQLRTEGNERQKFLSFPTGVFQIPQATAPRLCEWSEQREGKLNRAAGGRELHSWEDASPTNRPETLGLSVKQVAQHGFRMFLPLRDTQSTRRATFLLFSFPQNQAWSSTQAVVHHCETLKGVGAVNQHELPSAIPRRHPLINPSHKSPVATDSAGASSVWAAVTRRVREWRIIGCGFWVIAMGTGVDRRFTGLEMRSVSGKGRDVNYGLARTASSPVNRTWKLDKKNLKRLVKTDNLRWISFHRGRKILFCVWPRWDHWAHSSFH